MELRVRVLKTFWERLRGLLGTSLDEASGEAALIEKYLDLGAQKEKERGLGCKRSTAEPVLIEHCNSIHTFGMRYAIDVAFVDKNSKVVHAKRALLPNRFLSCRKARCVIERPASKEEWLMSGQVISIRNVSTEREYAYVRFR